MRKHKKRFIPIAVGIMLAAFLFTSVQAQSDLEDSLLGKPKHVELAQVVEEYVAIEAAKTNGYYSPEDGQNPSLVLQLTLKSVPEMKLSSLGGDIYFVHGIFKNHDNTTYDIDFFIQGKSGSINTLMETIHAVNDVARYTWYQENGIWKTKPVN